MYYNPVFLQIFFFYGDTQIGNPIFYQLVNIDLFFYDTRWLTYILAILNNWFIINK